MKTSAIWIIIAAVVVLGIIAYIVVSPMISNSYNSQNTQTSGNNPTPEQNTPAPSNPSPSSQVPSNTPVQISSFTFSPNSITISAGTSVTWTNMDSASHTITSDSGSELASQTLSNGQSYSHTFNAPGTYTYHCSIHTMMKGTIIVQ